MNETEQAEKKVDWTDPYQLAALQLKMLRFASLIPAMQAVALNKREQEVWTEVGKLTCDAGSALCAWYFKAEALQEEKPTEQDPVVTRLIQTIQTNKAALALVPDQNHGVGPTLKARIAMLENILNGPAEDF